MNNKYIYAARDTSTGKLINDITSHHKKYWDRKPDAINAINRHNSRSYNKNRPAELVTFELVEVKDNA